MSEEGKLEQYSLKKPDIRRHSMTSASYLLSPGRISDETPDPTSPRSPKNRNDSQMKMDYLIMKLNRLVSYTLHTTNTSGEQHVYEIKSTQIPIRNFSVSFQVEDIKTNKKYTISLSESKKGILLKKDNDEIEVVDTSKINLFDINRTTTRHSIGGKRTHLRKRRRRTTRRRHRTRRAHTYMAR